MEDSNPKQELINELECQIKEQIQHLIDVYAQTRNIDKYTARTIVVRFLNEQSHQINSKLEN